ncbi:hypothetical protein ACJZ2D_001302 [Fusarium nematophilum]
MSNITASVKSKPTYQRDAFLFVIFTLWQWSMLCWSSILPSEAVCPVSLGTGLTDSQCQCSLTVPRSNVTMGVKASGYHRDRWHSLCQRKSPQRGRRRTHVRVLLTWQMLPVWFRSGLSRRADFKPSAGLLRLPLAWYRVSGGMGNHRNIGPASGTGVAVSSVFTQSFVRFFTPQVTETHHFCNDHNASVNGGCISSLGPLSSYTYEKQCVYTHPPNAADWVSTIEGTPVTPGLVSALSLGRQDRVHRGNEQTIMPATQQTHHTEYISLHKNLSAQMNTPSVQAQGALGRIPEAPGYPSAPSPDAVMALTIIASTFEDASRGHEPIEEEWHDAAN